MKGSVIVRVGLAAMWLAHGLEKFGVKWPAWLAGGTQSVSGMLQLMAEETPFRVVRALIQRVMLPGAGLLQYPVGALEIGLGLALLLGVFLPYAALLGAAMQTFFWLGFFTLDWPMQYPLIIVAHLALAVPLLPVLAIREEAWFQVLRVPLAAVWLYQGWHDSRAYLVLGGLLLAGLGTRLLALLSLGLVVVMFQRESWGAWPWSYYLVAASLAALVVGQADRETSLLRLLPERWRVGKGA